MLFVFHVTQCNASHGECEDLRMLCRCLAMGYKALGHVLFDDASVAVLDLF